jgi:hypothetical protein
VYQQNRREKKQLDQIAEEFEKFGKRMEEEGNRAHGTALQLLCDPEKIRIALDLARFERDCPESDAVIRQLNPGLVDDLIETSSCSDSSMSRRKSDPFLLEPNASEIDKQSTGDMFEPIGQSSDGNLFERIGETDDSPLKASTVIFETIPGEDLFETIDEEEEEDRKDGSGELFEAITPPGSQQAEQFQDILDKANVPQLEELLVPPDQPGVPARSVSPGRDEGQDLDLLDLTEHGGNGHGNGDGGNSGNGESPKKGGDAVDDLLEF